MGIKSEKWEFVADIGNYRIFSVKLGYHAEAKVPLGKVPDAGRKAP